MHRPVLALCLFLALHQCTALPPSPGNELHSARFTEWQKEHGRVYDTSEEEMARFAIFKDNLALVESHNAEADQGVHSFRLKCNKFCDLSNDEYRAKYLGLKIQPGRSTNNPLYAANNSSDVPDAWDWRSKGIVTAVKDQGQCGSCWAFSAVATMEGRYAKDGGTLTAFSEQELVDCTDNGKDNCNRGGEMHDGISEIVKNHQGNIETEKQYKYTGRSRGKCLANDKIAVKTKFTGYTAIKSGDEDALKLATYNEVTISVGIDASSNKFQLYDHGVYNVKNCKKKSSQLDHGVAVVGYGTLKGKDYWLVKNSWNKDWGINGYILMSRNANNQCGIATDACFAVAANTTIA